jgi:hypothetical protein
VDRVLPDAYPARGHSTIAVAAVGHGSSRLQRRASAKRRLRSFADAMANSESRHSGRFEKKPVFGGSRAD